MSASHVIALPFNLYMDRSFLSAPLCLELIAELARASESPATVYGRSVAGTVDDRVRKVARLSPAPETVERVTRELLQAREKVEAHFGLRLTTCEEPQFLRYRVGDFFVAHQDGNTGMLSSDAEQSRKISVVVFLNRQAEAPEPGTYGGGSLVFTEWRANRDRGRYELAGEAGAFVAFASDLTHEVTPVTWGDRYSIVSWYG